MLENIKNIELLTSIRTTDLSESTTLYYEIAKELELVNKPHYTSRANFIYEQLEKNSGKIIFDSFREEWGIPNFDENILEAQDFIRGFLWCFRDFTTSWNDNQKSKEWFLSSFEARFVRRYEFWTCDNGYDECISVKEGTYKEILQALLLEGDYEVLSSPVFSKDELNNFILTYDSENDDYEIDEIIEDYIEANPNYSK